MSNNGGWWQPPTPPGPPPYGMPPGGNWGPAGPGGPMGPPPGAMGPGPWGPGAPGPWGPVPPAPKPGVIPLRPLSVGEIMSGIFTTIRYNFGSVYGPPLITGLSCLVLIAVWAGVEWPSVHAFWNDANNNIDVPDWTPSHGEVVNLLVALGVLFLLSMLAYFAVYVAASLSSVATLRHAVVGRRVKLRQTARESSSSLWRLIGATLLAQLLCMVPVLAVVVVFILLAAVTNGSSGIILLGILCYLGALGATIYIQIRLVPLAATVILEGKRPVEAIKRAWQLNEGAWWRSLGVTLLAYLVGVAIQYGVQQVLSVFFINSTTIITPGSDPSNPTINSGALMSLLVLYAVLVPVSLLINLLTLPMIPLAHGLLYIDRRIRRESLDIQLAEEAGVPFPGSAPPPGPQPGPQPPQDTPPPQPAG